jgi:hypothetical protein
LQAIPANGKPLEKQESGRHAPINHKTPSVQACPALRAARSTRALNRVRRSTQSRCKRPSKLTIKLQTPINRKPPSLQGRKGARLAHQRKTARGAPLKWQRKLLNRSTSKPSQNAKSYKQIEKEIGMRKDKTV